MSKLVYYITTYKADYNNDKTTVACLGVKGIKVEETKFGPKHNKEQLDGIVGSEVEIVVNGAKKILKIGKCFKRYMTPKNQSDDCMFWIEKANGRAIEKNKSMECTRCHSSIKNYSTALGLEDICYACIRELDPATSQKSSERSIEAAAFFDDSEPSFSFLK